MYCLLYWYFYCLSTYLFHSIPLVLSAIYRYVDCLRFLFHPLILSAIYFYGLPTFFIPSIPLVDTVCCIQVILLSSFFIPFCLYCLLFRYFYCLPYSFHPTRFVCCSGVFSVYLIYSILLVPSVVQVHLQSTLFIPLILTVFRGTVPVLPTFLSYSFHLSCTVCCRYFYCLPRLFHSFCTVQVLLLYMYVPIYLIHSILLVLFAVQIPMYCLSTPSHLYSHFSYDHSLSKPLIYLWMHNFWTWN